MTKQAMKPSEELLWLRERVCLRWDPPRVALLPYGTRVSYEAYVYMRNAARMPPYWWSAYHARTHLEVVEMIERAAVAALKEGPTP